MIERIEVSTQTVPTDFPESDGTLEWTSTTLVLVHSYAGGKYGLGYTYAAAGLPIYIALFGRDILTAGWQACIVSTSMARGALRELPKWQGKVENDWRDEQPGRMSHEAHTGPLATLNYNPRSRYYGAATTSSFYPVVVSELCIGLGTRTK